MIRCLPLRFTYDAFMSPGRRRAPAPPTHEEGHHAHAVQAGEFDAEAMPRPGREMSDKYGYHCDILPTWQKHHPLFPLGCPPCTSIHAPYRYHTILAHFV
ncbi:hypothetical protein G7K_1109-t1 [Saitoella complicata NRRL Y-17804]|uniref:Uncharacterized protein n=1 Tax=Saitoella complicata (strain BCRC 22490 / CBS 7301 / JCM 7358 / NBRC 10748 / NRRL Y-17804) TaxID=698492 RepID=A0A0E9NB25_SAICN|nr:hypothetical protein G7K_1109-t1 [Saitoella complicata NRRL Y-17804]